MHKSGLAGFIIDCKTDDLDNAARFWSEALRLPLETDAQPGYRKLASGPGGMEAPTGQRFCVVQGRYKQLAAETGGGGSP